VSKLTLDRDKVFKNIHIVLVSPQVPENIGLSARILKNTSFSNLILINPNLTNKSFEVAKRARDVLEKAKIYNRLEEIRNGYYFIFATTRRRREFKVIYNFNYILPQLVCLASSKRIAILFGKENFGLSYQELEFADSIFYIPANKSFPSYNLAFSVGIVCYEIFRFLEDTFSRSYLNLAKRKNIQALFDFINATLTRKFSEEVATSISKILAGLLKRTYLTKKECEILKFLFLKLS